ncbi:MAG TPA: hypothetical protein VGB61_12955 [Pyrinomonadaceae bacterium]
MSREDAVNRARVDLAGRLGVAEDEIKADSIEDADFPDASFGAGIDGEMSAQMITPGWRIRLKARGDVYEYRANRNRIRLFNFKGANHSV